MATKDQLAAEDQQFGEGFAEDHAAPAAQSDEQAFGIDPEAVPAAAEAPVSDAPHGEMPVGGEEGVIAEGEPPVEGAGEAAELPPESPAEEAAEPPAEVAAEGEDWEQKYKTLKGKYDAEVKGKSAGADEPAAEGGDMSAEDAMAKLAEDFGPEFVSMITAIASHEAKQAAGDVTKEVSNDVQSIIAHLTDQGQKAHFEAIASKHPDFMDVDDSTEFKAWKESLEPEAKAAVEEALAKGSASAVCDVLDQFKKTQEPDAAPKGDPFEEDDAALDAAAGVRSSGGGINLPENPSAGKGDFEDAWDKS